MTRILVPYHLDEHLPDLDVPVAPETTVTAALPDGGPWPRMAHLYESVAAAVADAVRRGARPAVLSGDCNTAIGTVHPGRGAAERIGERLERLLTAWERTGG
jgi:arginase